MAALTTATDAARPRRGGRRTPSEPDPTAVLLLTLAAFLGVLSLLVREFGASEPAQVAHPVVVTRRVYETRVITTIRGGPTSGTGTSVSQSSSSSGPLPAAPAVGTRTS